MFKTYEGDDKFLIRVKNTSVVEGQEKKNVIIIILQNVKVNRVSIPSRFLSELLVLALKLCSITQTERHQTYTITHRYSKGC